jgi:hypothetical protein
MYCRKNIKEGDLVLGSGSHGYRLGLDKVVIGTYVSGSKLGHTVLVQENIVTKYNVGCCCVFKISEAEKIFLIENQRSLEGTNLRRLIRTRRKTNKGDTNWYLATKE